MSRPTPAAGKPVVSAKLAKAVDRIRRRLGALDRSLTLWQTRLDGMRRQGEQLALLRQADLTAASQLDAMEPVLDTDSVARHVRDAISAGSWVDVPVPHLVVPNLWPASVYETLLKAVPPAVFFETRADGRCVLRLPPLLAPLPAIVTWEWVARMLDDVLAPALVRETLGLAADATMPGLRWRARLLARQPGYRGDLLEASSPPVVTAVLHLGSSGGGDGRLVRRADGVSTTVPFRPNTLVAFANATASYRYGDIDASPGARYACEIRVFSDEEQGT